MNKEDLNCKVARSYPAPHCEPGQVCKPIEGHFVTECENCKNFN